MSFVIGWVPSSGWSFFFLPSESWSITNFSNKLRTSGHLSIDPVEKAFEFTALRNMRNCTKSKSVFGLKIAIRNELSSNLFWRGLSVLIIESTQVGQCPVTRENSLVGVIEVRDRYAECLITARSSAVRRLASNTNMMFFFRPFLVQRM